MRANKRIREKIKHGKLTIPYQSPSDYLLPTVTSRHSTKMVVIYLLLCYVSYVSADHLGAYSSPQYAKMMYKKGYDTNALLPRETPPITFQESQETIAVADLSFW